MLRLNGRARAAGQATLRHLDKQGKARRVPALLARIRRGEPTDASRAWPHDVDSYFLDGSPRDPGTEGGLRAALAEFEELRWTTYEGLRSCPASSRARWR